jgi:hypothetical protein
MLANMTRLRALALRINISCYKSIRHQIARKPPGFLEVCREMKSEKNVVLENLQDLHDIIPALQHIASFRIPFEEACERLGPQSDETYLHRAFA